MKFSSITSCSCILVLFSLTKTKTKRVKNEKEMISLTKTKTKTKMLQQRKRKLKWLIWYQNENITKSRPKLKLKRKVCNENEIIFVDKASCWQEDLSYLLADLCELRTYDRCFANSPLAVQQTDIWSFKFRNQLS